MSSSHAALAQLPDPSRDPHAMILLDTADLPLSIDSLGRHGFRGRVPGHVPVHGRFQITLDPLALGHPDRLLAEAVRHEHVAGRQTRVWFRYVAAWALEKGALADLLTSRLRLSGRVSDRLSPSNGGWLYRFPEEGGADAPAAGATPAPGQRRREPRVTVRTPVRWHDGKDTLDGMVYNISGRGLFVLTSGPMPARGARVIVFYPLGPAKLSMVGAVVWLSGDMTPDHGGFGLELSNFDDGAGGRRWRAHVAEQLARTR